MSEYDKIAGSRKHHVAVCLAARLRTPEYLTALMTRVVKCDNNAGVAHDAKEIHANANLITAAPDLLAALEGMQG